MAFELTELPFEDDALEPYISARTIKYHYGKHHQGYVDKLNDAVEGTEWASKSLEEIIVAHAGDDGDSDLFNNAAQIWNHDFFWSSLSPQGGGTPDGVAAQLLDESFGSLKGFKDRFIDKAVGEFGSGWVWLVVENGGLNVITTTDAMTPLIHGHHPLVCCDTWEHAYYLDYQNDKKAFFEVFVDHMISWGFVASNLESQGEGNWLAAARFRNAQEEFARRGNVKEMARKAADALDSEEGEELEAARKTSAS